MPALQHDHEILDDANLHKCLVENIVPHPEKKDRNTVQVWQ